MLKNLPQTIKQQYKQSDIIKRIANGAFWSLAGTAVAKAILLLSSIALAHILGVAKYGELGLVRSTVNMFVCLGTVGMGVTATKYISQYLHKDKILVGKIIKITSLFALVSGIIIAFIIYFTSDSIAQYTSQTVNISDEIKIGTVILWATIMNGAINGILSGFEDFKHIAINTFTSSIIESILIIAGAYYYGVVGALLGYGLGTFSLLILNILSSSKNLKKNGLNINSSKLKFADFKILYKFSIPAALSSFLVAPTFWVIRTLIVKFDGMASLGIYEMADQWKIIILFIPSALSNIVLPILSSKTSTDAKKDFNQALKYNLILNFATTFILSLIILGFSTLITKAYGNGFNNVIPLIVLAFSTCFSSMASVFGIAIISKGKVWTGLLFNLLWAFIFISASYILLFMGYGVNGVAIALISSYIIHSIIQSIYIKCLVKNA